MVQHTHPARRGFTLIEMIAVLVIVGILSAMAVPRFGDAMVRRQAEAAALRIATDIRLARRQALQTATSVTLAFNPVRPSYVIVGMPSLNDPKSDYSVDLTREPYRVQIAKLDSGVKDALVYDGYGLPTSGDFTLVLQAGAQSRTITVDKTVGDPVITEE